MDHFDEAMFTTLTCCFQALAERMAVRQPNRLRLTMFGLWRNIAGTIFKRDVKWRGISLVVYISNNFILCQVIHSCRNLSQALAICN